MARHGLAAGRGRPASGGQEFIYLNSSPSPDRRRQTVCRARAPAFYEISSLFCGLGRVRARPGSGPDTSIVDAEVGGSRARSLALCNLLSANQIGCQHETTLPPFQRRLGAGQRRGHSNEWRDQSAICGPKQRARAGPRSETRFRAPLDLCGRPAAGGRAAPAPAPVSGPAGAQSIHRERGKCSAPFPQPVHASDAQGRPQASAGVFTNASAQIRLAPSSASCLRSPLIRPVPPRPRRAPSPTHLNDKLPIQPRAGSANKPLVLRKGAFLGHPFVLVARR